MNAWKKIAKEDGPCLVIEDDFRLTRDLSKEELIQTVETSRLLLSEGTFDYISLGYHQAAFEKKTNQLSIVRIVSPFWGTMA